MARDPDIERRLHNWARWRLTRGTGALGYASVNLADAGQPADTSEAVRIPVSDVEASETDLAVRELQPLELRRAVVEFYVGAGHVAEKCRRLGCGERTLYDRIDRAYRLLSQAFADQHRARSAERGRVEALVQAGRPVAGRGEF